MKTQQAQPKTQPEGHAGNKMDIDVKINSISMEGNILATASINLKPVSGYTECTSDER